MIEIDKEIAVFIYVLIGLFVLIRLAICTLVWIMKNDSDKDVV